MLGKKKRAYEPDELSARARLRANLGDMLARNEIPANRIAELANDINRVAPTECSNLRGPTGSNAARRLRRQFLKKSQWMPDYLADVRTWNPKTQKIVSSRLPMQLLHEVVAVLHKAGIKDVFSCRDNMDPLSLEHLLHCEEQAGCELLGMGIWGDGAPTQWDRSETIDVISVNFPGLTGKYKGLRIPLVALPHSRVCAETWLDIFEIIKWCLTILATGAWPTCRHDGSPWQKSDNCRKTARPFPRAALVEVRQDWKFAVEVFGFPAHNTAEGCCWKCTCTPRQVPRVVNKRANTNELLLQAASRGDAEHLLAISHAPYLCSKKSNCCHVSVLLVCSTCVESFS